MAHVDFSFILNTETNEVTIDEENFEAVASACVLSVIAKRLNKERLTSEDLNAVELDELFSYYDDLYDEMHSLLFNPSNEEIAYS